MVTRRARARQAAVVRIVDYINKYAHLSGAFSDGACCVCVARRPTDAATGAPIGARRSQGALRTNIIRINGLQTSRDTPLDRYRLNGGPLIAQPVRNKPHRRSSHWARSHRLLALNLSRRLLLTAATPLVLVRADELTA